MKNRIQPDPQKAKSLVNMAKATHERLNLTNITTYPGNSLVDFYDIIHRYMEAISVISGYKFKGDGAHRELIHFVCEEFGFTYETKIFLQQLREFRNRISYEGFSIHENFIKLNLNIIETVIADLHKLYLTMA